MKRMIRISTFFAAFTAVSSAALAETPAPVAPIKTRAAEQVLTVTATVVSVDQETRRVVLKGPEGDERAFIASDEVRNLAQVKPGDELVIRYLERIAMKLYPVEASGLGEIAKTEVSRADPGQKPHGTVTRSTELTGRVAAMDVESRSVTLEGKHGALTVAVHDDVDLTKVTVGDMVKIEYVESLAVSVNSPNEPGQ